ncbi:MAG: ATP-binding protein [Nitrospira sp.]|nr:ATP-binding protein [Nitrospira sp.]
MIPPFPSTSFSDEPSPNRSPTWLPTREDISLILEASKEALFVTDRRGHVLSLNPVAQQLIGRNQRAIGYPLHELLHCVTRDEQSIEGCPLQTAVSSGQVTVLPPYRWIRPDGAALDLSATYWPRRKGMTVIGTLAVIHNLTEQQEMQRDIQRVARLAEDAPNPIAEFDESGTMLYANTAAMELMNEAGNHGDSILSIFPPRLEQIILSCLDGNPPSGRCEHALDHMVLAWTFFPIGDLRQVRAYGVDITADVALRKAKESAEESAKAKGLFLATMSHELRTPMNGVLGCTRLLQDTALTHQQQELIITMQRSAEALLALVNDILDFSKIEAGKMTLEVADVDLRSLVKDVITLVSELAGQKGLTLTNEVHENVPPLFRGDPVRLRQILFNLVGNAIKFTERGGVSISVGMDQVSSPEAEHVVIRWTVQDTGIGMTKSQLDRLFEAYVQADTSTTRRFGGTGLGLMICRQLVTLMGGTISVESAPGKGSTFTYTTNLLPAIQRTAPVSSDIDSTIQTAASQLPRRILVVDDNEINQVVACKFLQKLGYQVEVARNGRDAIESLARANYDAVLMDCEMPGMDGYETVRSIRKKEEKQRSPRLPIIAMTGNASIEDARQCKEAGMDDVVTKPISLTSLQAVLDHLLHTVSSQRELIA